MLIPAAGHYDFRAVAATLRQEYALLDQVLAGLRPERWPGPSACVGWPLQKVVAHLSEEAAIGLATLEQHLAGAPPLGRERRQAIWDYFDSLAPEPLHAAFRESHATFLAYLDALPAEQQRQRVRYFAGEAPLAEYLQYRLNELALHSWDIRAALDPTARLLPTTTRTHLPYVLDTVDTVEQEVPADVRARLAGTTYKFSLTGVVQVEIGLVVAADKVAVADPTDGAAAATLRLPAETFIRLCAGRLPLPAAEAAGEVLAAGDRRAIVGLNALFAGY